jgi:hypothetical protein
VQSMESFAPSEEEIERARSQAAAAAATATAMAQPLKLSIAAGEISHDSMEELKQRIEEAPGPAEVQVEIHTSAGKRTIRLGEEFTVRNTPTVRAELQDVFAPVASAATG